MGGTPNPVALPRQGKKWRRRRDGEGLGGEEVGRWGKECPVALAFYVVANQEGNLSKLGAVRTPSPPVIWICSPFGPVH